MADDCPEETGPFHFWEVDGPNWVMCPCGAEGRIVITDDDPE